MNFLNMFSDEAPISNSGYRSSLYTDPSIMQGVKFLNYEKDIKNNLSENLKLISQTDGSDLVSAKVVNGRIYEGMEASQLSTSGASGVQSEKKAMGKKRIENQDIEILEFSYKLVNSMYEEALKSLTKDYQGGIANNAATSGEYGERQQILKGLQIIQTSLSNMNVQISDIITKRSKANIQAYYNVMDQLRDVKYKLIDTNNKIIKLTRRVDPVSAVAQREQTHILSKQRYYMYIFWFILTAVVIYVMIANMINPDSSFSILVICIIILVCIFGFIMYDKITGSWYYDIKNGIGRISMPRIDNIINFDPLVSIKYTS